MYQNVRIMGHFTQAVREGGKFIFEGMIEMVNVKVGFVSFEGENPFIGDALKEIPYEDARKVTQDITKILCEHNFTIRQAAAVLDLVKAGLVDRYLVAKTTQ